MNEIQAATERVRRWRITAEVLFWAFWAAVVTLPALMHLTGHRGLIPALVVVTVDVVLYAAHCAAFRQMHRALDAHPLAFLIRLRQEFGAPTSPERS